MPFRELLASDYVVDTKEKIRLDDGREGYVMDDNVYFTITADNKEMIHMEQASLAYYMAERNYTHMAVPIPNVHGNWYTDYRGKKHLVLRTKLKSRKDISTSAGRELAEFHETGTGYPYEPHFASSYGQWHYLWTEKLTMFEQKVEHESNQKHSSFYRSLMDYMPYIIGISENAIQYIQETEGDKRFHHYDQGVIAFRRYRDQLTGSLIWMEDLLYDHPARDLAEYIRILMLNEKSGEEMSLFLKDYQLVRPLSIFGWRSLYARLLFPVHIFDWLEKCFRMEREKLPDKELVNMMERQKRYEQGLRNFFKYAGINHEADQIPVLHWL
ncbi:hypothetical protein [Virgibacillus sediminis]|uniref:Spore coat protein YutH n=1 Tax=Virgibacillus sediminis TaxID=202260 RepID=A0ABV7A276_9BACI